MLRILPFTFLLLSTVVKASLVTGSAPAYKGREILLIAYDDLITFREVVVDRDTVDEEGFFTLKTEPVQTGVYILRAARISAFATIEPGKDLIVYFPPPDPEQPVTFAYTHVVSLAFDSASGALNHKLEEIREQTDQFLTDNYALIIQKRAAKPAQQFASKLTEKYASSGSYLKSYAEYTAANLKYYTGSARHLLAQEYLTGKPVLYHNPEYMKFFSQYFDNYLYQFAISVKGYKAKNLINSGAAPVQITGLMQQDALFTNDNRLAELVLIYGLDELRNNADFNLKGITRVLQQIAKTSAYPEHRRIASNTHYMLTSVASGSKLPEFRLKDTEGNVITPATLSGKPAVLTFWASGCGECIQQMKVLKSFEQRYKDKVRFVYIAIDENITAQQRTYKTEALEGIKVTGAGNYDFLEAFRIRTVPVFYIIDAGGRFQSHPAPSPSEGMDRLLHELTQ